MPSPPRRTHIALFPDAVTATENRISFCQFPSAGRRAGQLWGSYGPHTSHLCLRLLRSTRRLVPP